MRLARRWTERRYLMCPPVHFDVRYSINPWMDPARPVDPKTALRQWEWLVTTYASYGHQVELLAPAPELPDMVFTANGATVIGGRALLARFAHAERRAEASHHRRWHRRALGAGAVHQLRAVNEAEGDFAVVDGLVLAGHGFRTTREAHGELARLAGRRVVSLELVDPRLYHLDVALAVLDDAGHHLAYYPPAFSPDSRRTLRRLFPDAVLATSADAYAFGLNLVSDGRHVFLPDGAERLAGALEDRGYRVVPVEMSELHKGGGSVKCCTQELRRCAGGHSDEPIGKE